MAGNKVEKETARTLRARIAELESALAATGKGGDSSRADDVRAVEAQYRQFLEVLPDGVFVYVDDRLVFANAVGIRMLGASSIDQLVGRPALSFVPEEHVEEQRARRRKVLAERCSLPPIEQRRRRLDGSKIWVETSANFTLWEGRPAFLGLARDVTARKEAEAALVEARTRLEAITQNIPGAVFRRVLHPDGRVEFPYISPGVKEFSGFDADAVMADPSAFLDRILPDMRGNYRAALAESAESLKPFDLELAAAGPGGTVRWLRSQGRPRRRDDGAVVWDGLIIDITERRAAEERAQRAHHWLLGAIESMPSTFMLWDPADRLVMWNQRAAALMPSGDELAEGMAFDDVIRPAADAIRRALGDAAAAEWTERRNRQHREAIGEFQFQGEGDRWYVVGERRTGDGFTVTIGREVTEQKRNEDRLRDSEAEYRSLLESLPDGVSVDVDGVLVFLNAAAARILGAGSKEALIGGPLLDIVPEEYRAAQIERRRILMTERGTVPMVEQERVRLDGSRLWVETVATAVQWEGRPAILGVFRDITEQKQAQDHVRRLDHWLRGAVESMPEGFMLWDPDDRLVLWNQQILKFYPAHQRLSEGASFESLIQGTAAAMRKRIGADAAEAWLESRRKQRREARGAHEFEGRGGTSFVVAERRTPEGFTVTLVTDVTEHRRSEDRLRASEKRHRALIDLSPDAIYVHRQGRVVLCNEAAIKLFGARDAAALIGRHTLDLVDPDFHEMVLQRQAQIAAAGTRTVYMRQRRLRLDGTAFWAEVAAAVIEWDGARGGIVIVRDISNQMRAEEQLRRSKETAELASRAKTEFLANISHELRTPLNAIIGFSDVMQREMFGPLGTEQYRAYARDIYQSGTHLHEVINDILDMSKIEAGKLELNEEPMEVDATVQRCVRLLRPRADDGRIALETRVADNLPALYADHRKVKQILINLLSNAVKFTKPGGNVTVEASLADDGAMVLAVADTGIGMAAEDIPRALQPFGQLDSALNRKYEGTGLGLPLTKSLTDLHGGTFAIESRPGEGTRVTVRFPAERVLIRTAAE